MDGEKVGLEQCSDANCHGRVTLPSDGIPASDREYQVGQPRLPSESEGRPHSCHAQGAACLLERRRATAATLARRRG